MFRDGFVTPDFMAQFTRALDQGTGFKQAAFDVGAHLAPVASGENLVARRTFPRPVRCLLASLLFGGASALGPALQSVGVTSGYYLFNAAPYVLTLAIIVLTSSRDRALLGQPAELRMAR